eukprot:681016-Rhodomonas_salina.1
MRVTARADTSLPVKSVSVSQCLSVAAASPSLWLRTGPGRALSSSLASGLEDSLSEPQSESQLLRVFHALPDSESARIALPSLLPVSRSTSSSSSAINAVTRSRLRLSLFLRLSEAPNPCYYRE